ncbi:MAG: hypothetical protein AB7Q17_01705 [Phycisphaerae bacterium]
MRAINALIGRGAWCAWGALLLATAAQAAPYHLRYEPTETFPEGDGWERLFSDPDGTTARSTDAGAFELDTSGSISSFDTYLSPAGALSLDLGEELRVSWRMQTVANTRSNGRSDISVLVLAPNRTYTEIFLGVDFVSADEPPGGVVEHNVPLVPGQPNDFHLVSHDFDTYSFFVGETFAFSGRFSGEALAAGGRIAWGDTLIGAASHSVWSYVDVSVIPEPSSLTVVVASIGVGAIVRRRNICDRL